MNPIKLILLPGLDGTGKMFQPLLANFTAGIEAEVVSYPNFGSQDYRDLVRFAEERLPKEKEFVLVAESFSGPIAVMLAAKRPKNLKGLILCSTFLSAPRTIPPILRELLAHLIFHLPSFDCAIRYFLLGEDASQQLVEQLKNSLTESTPNILIERLRSVFAVNVVSVMREITLPTLCIVSTSERLVGNAIETEISSSSLQTISIEGPHCILQAQPEKSSQVIAEFCKTLTENNALDKSENT